MELQEKLVDCKRCKSNACSEVTGEDYKMYLCMTCGFTTSLGSTNDHRTEIEVGLPEIYKALRFEDEDGLNWYPTSVNLIRTNGMVYIDGTSIKDWKWAAVPSRKIKLKEKLKYPEGVTHTLDMPKKKLFEQDEFMDSLDYIKYFDLVKNENPS